MSDRLNLVIEEVAFLIEETARMNAQGPHLLVIHTWHQPGSECLAGEEVAAVRFMFRSRQFQMRLGLGPLVLLDYLARHRWRSHSASQLAAGLNADAFCAQHGANAPTSRKQTRRFTHGAVKVYVERIRDAMTMVFREAGVNLDPHLVLISEPGYRLKASIEWVHLTDPRLVRSESFEG